MVVSQLCRTVSATTCRSTQSRGFVRTSEQCSDWGQADLGIDADVSADGRITVCPAP
jgi:hypothetical protein